MTVVFLVGCSKFTQGNATQPLAFVMYITMTNRSVIGGTTGVVRVKYHDGELVDYAIPVDTTVQISLAGGGTPGADDAIEVTNGGSAARLVGQASIILHSNGKPNPVISTTSFCTTTAIGGTPPF
jgi:hypothetical protein